MKNVNEIEYYSDDTEIEFGAFLNRVKYAFKKVFGCTSTKYDWFSVVMSDGRTMWQHIKQDGSATWNCDGVAIDIEFGRVIYVAIF